MRWNNIDKVFPWVVFFLIIGCASTAPPTLSTQELKDRGVKTVAVMPVDNKTKDDLAAQAVRKELYEALYFKGYAKVPLDVVDDKVAGLYKESMDAGNGRVSPKVLGDLLAVDAVMYCTLQEWDTSLFYLYGSTSVAMVLEMRCAATGETLWSASEEVTVRNYDITRKRLLEKSYQCYEPASRELVARIMTTLPGGPASPGSPPATKASWWKFW